jgi:hypothetical protein
MLVKANSTEHHCMLGVASSVPPVPLGAVAAVNECECQAAHHALHTPFHTDTLRGLHRCGLSNVDMG